MIWIGGIILVLTMVAIVKKYEPRMVLFISGLAMSVIAGQYLKAFTDFSKALVSDPLVAIIVTSMGFAYVMTFTECDKHFSYFALKYVVKVRALLIPGTVAIIWLFSIAITSPSGLSAAVGPIIIPILTRAGIHPAIAASSLLMGTWGSFMSVSSVHIANVSKLSGVDGPSLIVGNFPAGVVGLVVSCLALTVVAKLRKEDSGYEIEQAAGNDEMAVLKEFKINYLRAALPLTPIILLILGSKQIGLLPALPVTHAMLAGTLLAFVVTRPDATEMTKQFYSGMGQGFGFVISLIAAAAVFTGGMSAIGLTGALVEGMKSSTNIAKLAGAYGPLFIAALCGSGDAATLAFNNSITPHAAEFGLTIDKLGMTAFLSGALGRTMSPVAGVCIICAQIAQVSPIELSKRVMPGIILTSIFAMLVLLYM
jgi:DcuC family C4-dicarboxylate transporter